MDDGAYTIKRTRKGLVRKLMREASTGGVPELGPSPSFRQTPAPGLLRADSRGRSVRGRGSRPGPGRRVPDAAPAMEGRRAAWRRTHALTGSARGGAHGGGPACPACAGRAGRMPHAALLVRQPAACRMPHVPKSTLVVRGATARAERRWRISRGGRGAARGGAQLVAREAATPPPA